MREATRPREAALLPGLPQRLPARVALSTCHGPTGLTLWIVQYLWSCAGGGLVVYLLGNAARPVPHMWWLIAAWMAGSSALQALA